MTQVATGKKTSTAPKKSSGLEDATQRPVNRALVLCDAFKDKFTPLTHKTPHCLLPLANVPLLEYTLEWLALNGIEECWLLCVQHADRVKSYIQESRWSDETTEMAVSVLMANNEPECSSVGDALRRVDQMGILEDDFVLVHGDTVSNMNLAKMLELHRERRKADRNYILTMALKKMSPRHRTREQTDGAFFVLDSSNGECLHYEPVPNLTTKPPSLKLDSRILSKTSVILHNDLSDCGIDICAPNILALFSENFDYQEMRRDLLRGTLNSFDLLGYRLGTHLLTQEYAARVRNPRLYDAISRDVLSRWTYPIVPELNVSGLDAMRYQRGHRYFGTTELSISQNAKIETGVLVGSKCVIEESTRIKDSVIGLECKIGEGCAIEGSYLFKGVHVAQNCTIKNCIIGNQVSIQEGSTISSGCIVEEGVILGAQANIPEGMRVKKRISLESFSELNLNEDHSKDQLYELEPIEDRISTLGLALPEPSNELVYTSDEEEEEASSSLDSSDRYSAFIREATEIIRQSILSEIDLENTALEVNGLRLACNASFKECRQALIEVLLEIAQVVNWRKWSPLLSKYTTNEDEQVDLIVQLVSALQRRNTPDKHLTLRSLLVILYDEDVVEEDSIICWFEDQSESNPYREAVRSIFFRSDPSSNGCQLRKTNKILAICGRTHKRPTL